MSTTTLINASAGSGKTYRLAIAYIQALLLPQSDGSPALPQQVLATTFTRAAASEILERVLRRLALAVVSEEERKSLLVEIGRSDLNRDDLATLLGSVCQALPMLQVGTIDALFARIIRVIGLDLAFPSAWRVADETEKNDLALDAADRMLRGPEAALSRDQWLRYAQFKSRIQVRAALVKLLEENRFHLVDAPIHADNVELERPQMVAADEAATVMLALEKFDGHPRNQNGKPNQNWLKAVDAMRSRFASELQLIDLLEHKFFRFCGEERGTYHRYEAPERLREILGPWVERAVEDLGRLHMARLPALAALARRYHEFRRHVAYASAAYGFAEIEAAARLLPEHIFQEDIYFRLDGQVRHLLLDEFQDTSLGQFRFLWQLMTEIRSENRLLFIVGDVKQSIYGWRGADRRLLNELRGWLDPQGQDKNLKEETLEKNWRSAPSVLNAVDRIFGHLDGFTCLDPETYEDAKEQAKRDQAEVRRRAAASFISNYKKLNAGGNNAQLAGRVRLLITPKDAEDSIDPEVEEMPGELETILAAVVQHRQEDANREIAILCRRRKWIPSIIAGLRLRGIEASGEGGSPVTDSAAVEMVLSMLTWLDHPGHSLARGHVELGGMADVFGLGESGTDPFLPKRIQTTIMRNGLAVTLSGWIRNETFRRRCSVHDQVRCEQLVELARHWDAAGGGRFAQFVHRVRAQSLDNPISSRVRVMTIHGSKGLEFEAVILADMQSKGRGGVGPHFLVEMTTPDAPPEVQLVPDQKVAEILGLQDVAERYQQNQFEEDLSVLYVGLTRAKSYLDVVVTEPKRKEPSLAGILFEGWGHEEAGTHIVEQNPAGVPLKASSTVVVMDKDPAMWEAGESLDVAQFQPAPDRLNSITPSGREGAGVVKLGLILNSGNNLALERGTAVHALLSRIEWIDDLPTLDAWIASIPEQEARADVCRVAAQELHLRLSYSHDLLTQVFDPALWLSRWKKEKVVRLEVWRERRFAVVLEHELMNGSFDRVVCGFDAKGRLVRAEILDFKTDRLDNDTEREERRLYYQPQLDAYARALNKLTDLPAIAIQTQLVWIN
jgi:ATP-dependent helicase/nuclease subunit A